MIVKKEKNSEIIKNISKKTNKKISKTNNSQGLVPPIFEALFIVVNRGKGENVIKFLSKKDIKAKITSYGVGTAPSKMQSLLGLYNKEKEVVFGIIPLENSDKLLDELDNKFLKNEQYSGIAFTIVLKSITKTSMQAVL